MKKIPFYLVTGFLGSGKTTLLSNLLKRLSGSKRILLIQNEFSESNIDGDQLHSQGWNFSLLEMNKGSVFCVCLFSDFKRQIIEQTDAVKPEMIVLETTGMADPIAVAQLLDDPAIRERIYLAHIYTIVDAPRYNVMEDRISSVAHQIQIADTLVINKTDLVNEQDTAAIVAKMKLKNPFAEIIVTSFCRFDIERGIDAFFRPQPIVLRNHIQGELTRCATDYVSSILKTTTKTDKQTLTQFLHRSDESIYRIKGYVCLNDGTTCMVQHVPGQTEIIPVEKSRETTELIAIGDKAIDFTELINL